MPSLHLDIEDGNFVPNITFGMKTIRAISSVWSGHMDAHLMVTNPGDYLVDLIALGITSISFHIEAEPYPLRLLERIRKSGARPGIALNPGVPIKLVEHALAFSDYVLLLSAEPDGRGELFQPHILKKVAELRRMLGDNVEIWVDGGIGENEAMSLCKTGADTLIMGRAIFKSQDPHGFLDTLVKRLNTSKTGNDSI
jgi:ribulose-phosphate 3-epimerase